MYAAPAPERRPTFHMVKLTRPVRRVTDVTFLTVLDVASTHYEVARQGQPHRASLRETGVCGAGGVRRSGAGGRTRCRADDGGLGAPAEDLAKHRARHRAPDHFG